VVQKFIARARVVKPGKTQIFTICDLLAVDAEGEKRVANGQTLLTVMATHGRMHVAVWVLAAGLAVLLVAALVGFDRNHAGTHVMWLLNAVFACMAALLLLLERHRMKATLPYVAAALPLLVCAGLVALKPLFFRLNVTAALMLCAVYGLLVLGSAVAASPVLRALLSEKVHRKSAAD
jgi:hypothetical protein